MKSITRRRALGLAAAAALVVGLPACGDGPARGNDRWVTAENTTVELDWDAVGKAYQEADGPEDLERRVNELYAGDEIISVSVRDLDEKTQEVTGFFDRNGSGRVEDDEKVFTIRRDVVGPESAQVQIAGHGPYAGYHSPVWDIATGMFLGSMISRAFSPGYVPMYTRPYVTPPARRGELTAHRNTYRQQNPDKFRQGKSSRSGRSYGAKGNQFGGGKPTRSTPAPRPRSRSFGGGRFGRRIAAGSRVVRLDA